MDISSTAIVPGELGGPGGPNDPKDRGRQALVILVTPVAPETIDAVWIVHDMKSLAT